MKKLHEQVYLGKALKPHMRALDAECSRRDISRARAVNIVLLHVLKNRMLADILDKEGEEAAVASVRAAEATVVASVAQQQERPPVVRTSRNLFEDSLGSLLGEEKKPRADLPEPSRKALDPPPMDAGSPRYIGHVSNISYRDYGANKTKAQLREELRQAVENTR